MTAAVCWACRGRLRFWHRVWLDKKNEAAEIGHLMHYRCARQRALGGTRRRAAREGR